MHESIKTDILKNLILLARNNFSDCQRTPWAGEVIAQTYKSDLYSGEIAPKIGESWEFSCDPIYPSILRNSNDTLPDLVRKFPSEVLSPQLAQNLLSPSCEILVKIVNSAVPLSLQVHPQDDDSSLMPDECGKPESWLILQAEPGAGVYLGFARALSVDFLKSLIRSGQDLRPFLNFVSVRPGDYFEIAPGVPHALGGGVTLLEPQKISPGKSGKTYRIWDWGRRYNTNGEPVTTGGFLRKLHIEEALRIIDPRTQVGSKFSTSCVRVGANSTNRSGVSITKFPKNDFYQVHRLNFPPGGTADLSLSDGYAALTCLTGELEFVAVDGGKTCLETGSSAVMPNSARNLSLTSKNYADLVVVVPATATFKTGS